MEDFIGEMKNPHVGKEGERVSGMRCSMTFKYKHLIRSTLSLSESLLSKLDEKFKNLSLFGATPLPHGLLGTPEPMWVSVCGFSSAGS